MLLRPKPIVVIGLTAFIVSATGCFSTKPLVPDERIKSIDDSAAAVNEAERREAAGNLDPSAISLVNDFLSQEYVVGPNDVVNIEVFRVEELSGNYTVDRNGKLNLPLVGRVQVSDLTIEKIEDTLEALYGQTYLRDPEITVRMESYESQKVTLLSEAGGGGVFPLKGPTTLMDVFAQGRAVSQLAELDTVIIFRQEKEAVYGYLVNMNDVIAGKRPDPQVFGNDRIVVPLNASAAFLRQFQIGIPGFGGFRPM